MTFTSQAIHCHRYSNDQQTNTICKQRYCCLPNTVQCETQAPVRQWVSLVRIKSSWTEKQLSMSWLYCL